MSTLQSLLSKINVQQVGGAPAPGPAPGKVLGPAPAPGAAPAITLTNPVGLNEGKCHVKWDVNNSRDMAPNTLDKANINNLTPGNFAQGATREWSLPPNMDKIIQGISNFKPTTVYTELTTNANVIQVQKPRGAAGAAHGATESVAATTLEVDPDNTKKLRVRYLNAASINNPSTGQQTFLYNGNMITGGNGAFFRASYLACLMHYVADNTMINNNGALEDIGASQPSGVAGYAFLAQGGVGAYATHLPNSTVVDGLPGAMALAAFQPISFNPIIGHINREGNVGQTGGGAFVLSSAPSVRKYCADSNYLVQEIKRQQALMAQKGLTLTGSSQAKVDNLLAKLQRSEAELCKTYELLDNLVGAKEDGKDLIVTDGQNVAHDFQSPIDINDVQQAQSQLQALKKKLSVKALSTVLTLSQIVQDAITNAATAAKGGTPANVTGQFNNQRSKMGNAPPALPPVAAR